MAKITPVLLAPFALALVLPMAQAQLSDRWVCRVAMGSFGPSPYRSRIETILGGTNPQQLPLTPVAGNITSTFGWRSHPIHGTQSFHTGIDIAAPHGTPIYSSDAGTVEIANHGGSIGLQVVLDHSTHKTVYGHMSQIAVTAGQSISRGQPIGYVGSTGDSTGPHLHFTVFERQHNQWQRIDPATYLAQSPTPSNCQHLTRY